MPSGRASTSSRPAARASPSGAGGGSRCRAGSRRDRHQEADQEHRVAERDLAAAGAHRGDLDAVAERHGAEADRREDDADGAGARRRASAEGGQPDDDQRGGKDREQPVGGGDGERAERAGLDVIENGRTNRRQQRTGAPPTSPVVAVRKIVVDMGSPSVRGVAVDDDGAAGLSGNQGARSRDARELSQPGRPALASLPCPCSR